MSESKVNNVERARVMGKSAVWIAGTDPDRESSEVCRTTAPDGKGHSQLGVGGVMEPQLSSSGILARSPVESPRGVAPRGFNVGFPCDEAVRGWSREALGSSRWHSKGPTERFDGRTAGGNSPPPFMDVGAGGSRTQPVRQLRSHSHERDTLFEIDMRSGRGNKVKVQSRTKPPVNSQTSVRPPLMGPRSRYSQRIQLAKEQIRGVVLRPPRLRLR